MRSSMSSIIVPQHSGSLAPGFCLKPRPFAPAMLRQANSDWSRFTAAMKTNRSAAECGVLPPSLAAWLSGFRDCFTAPVWNHVLLLVAGAVLAPGRRTVSQALRVMGLAATGVRPLS